MNKIYKKINEILGSEEIKNTLITLGDGRQILGAPLGYANPLKTHLTVMIDATSEHVDVQIENISSIGL